MFEKKVKWAIGIEIFALIVLCVGIISERYLPQRYKEWMGIL